MDNILGLGAVCMWILPTEIQDDIQNGRQNVNEGTLRPSF